MDKRVTRRAVLGTIVGGLAVAPFVIRTMRRSKSLDIPLSEYEIEWQKYYQQTQVPIENCEGPSSITLANRFDSGQKISHLQLISTYDSDDFPILPSGIPSFSGVQLGEYHIEEVGSRLFLQDKTIRHCDATPWKQIPLVPTGTEFLYVVEGGSLTPAIKDSDGVIRTDPALWTKSGYRYFYFPFMGTVTMGQSWQVEAENGLRDRTTFTLEGFALIAERKTAKITFSQPVHGPHNIVFSGVSYVDIETNRLIREEGRAYSKGEQGESRYIFQCYFA